MDQLLFYTSVGFILLAILCYLFAAVVSFKYLTGLGSTTELDSISFGLVLIGAVLMLIASAINIKFNLDSTGNWWDPILIVNSVDILLNLAVLHTIYRNWDRKITAWLTIATLVADANLRFIILYFF